MKIMAAVVRELNKLRIEELELAPPKANEVLIKVAYTGLCHSDLHGVTGDMTYPLPIVGGHETSGYVEQIGEGVESLKVGDRVFCAWQVPCGVCPECVAGNTVVCRTSFMGHATGTLLDGTSRLTDRNGEMVHHGAFVSGFATHAVVPERGAIKVRDDFPMDQACFMGCCVPTGLGAVWNRARVRPGEAVAIWGLGGVGLNVLRGAAIVKAYPIVAVDCNPQMEEMAYEWGATHFIDNSKTDPIPIIMDLTDEVGVDFAFEAIGDPGAVVQAWWSIRKAGSLIQIGITPESKPVPLQLTYMPVHMKSIIGAMYGHYNPQVEIPKLIDMALREDLKLDRLITERLSLEKINDAAQSMINKEIKGRAVIEFV